MGGKFHAQTLPMGPSERGWAADPCVMGFFCAQQLETKLCVESKLPL